MIDIYLNGLQKMVATSSYAGLHLSACRVALEVLPGPGLDKIKARAALRLRGWRTLAAVAYPDRHVHAGAEVDLLAVWLDRHRYDTYQVDQLFARARALAAAEDRGAVRTHVGGSSRAH